MRERREQIYIYEDGREKRVSIVRIGNYVLMKSRDIAKTWGIYTIEKSEPSELHYAEKVYTLRLVREVYGFYTDAKEKVLKIIAENSKSIQFPAKIQKKAEKKKPEPRKRGVYTKVLPLNIKFLDVSKYRVDAYIDNLFIARLRKVDADVIKDVSYMLLNSGSENVTKIIINLINEVATQRR